MIYERHEARKEAQARMKDGRSSDGGTTVSLAIFALIEEMAEINASLKKIADSLDAQNQKS